MLRSQYVKMIDKAIQDFAAGYRCGTLDKNVIDIKIHTILSCMEQEKSFANKTKIHITNYANDAMRKAKWILGITQDLNW